MNGQIQWFTISMWLVLIYAAGAFCCVFPALLKKDYTFKWWHPFMGLFMLGGLLKIALDIWDKPNRYPYNQRRNR